MVEPEELVVEPEELPVEPEELVVEPTFPKQGKEFSAVTKAKLSNN